MIPELNRTALEDESVEVPPPVAGFIDISERLTGFEAFDLYATGMAQLYHDTTVDQVGREAVGRFIGDMAAAGGDPDRLVDETSRDIARAVTHLWYLGVWPALARSVHRALGREKANVAFTVAPEAYPEGLVWRTFHGHPPGAKAPGFGTWADPPPGAPPLTPPERAAHGTGGAA
ncbi:hypothetical protein ACH4U6_01130 [Streptomyces netropsis]|uniref:hypothetical protein n=1 Tax=Streptomyces netropsis TaxID=55404 RepID=UPI0037A63F88